MTKARSRSGTAAPAEPVSHPEVFSRQLPIWGEEGQGALQRATVLVAGLGGLGCLMAELLVRAGVGKVHVCDCGVVDETDLNRQIFYTRDDIGRAKLEVAVQWLRRIHPHCEVVPLKGNLLNPDLAFPAGIDAVADCLDTFESRFALWDRLGPGTFFVHAGVEQTFGQVVTLVKGQTRSPRAIFENARRDPRVIPVNGASSAVLSALAASEVQHALLGRPRLLEELLVVELSGFHFDRIRLQRPAR